MISILILIYVISLILSIIITIKLERIPGYPLTVRDVLEDDWVLIFIPVVNTASVALVLLVLSVEYIAGKMKITKLWNKLMDIEL
jgi:hypothetical protein